MSLRALFSFCAALTVVALAAACGAKIGDSCTQSTDCSPDGDRVCDVASTDGYCTVEGCDFDTCPGESVCVRFFPISQLATACAMDADCAFDEICAVGGRCAPRSTERRFCMLKCSSNGDCRSNYECRDETRRVAHGGMPVLSPEAAMSETPAFCASSRPCTKTEDCDLGDVCDLGARFCVRP